MHLLVGNAGRGDCYDGSVAFDVGPGHLGHTPVDIELGTHLPPDPQILASDSMDQEGMRVTSRLESRRYGKLCSSISTILPRGIGSYPTSSAI